MLAVLLLTAFQLPPIRSAAASQPATPPPFLLTAQPGKSFRLVLTPPAAHHMNAKAPASATRGSVPGVANTKTERQIVFDFPEGPAADAPADFQVAAYLCDDANTYCVKQTANTHWDGRRLATQASGATSTEAATAASKGASSATEAGQDGDPFIDNDPSRALANAEKEKLPLLIDFYGIWCPPCNDLNTRVFSEPGFKKASRRFVRLKLDVDKPISWELKSRYKVGGYPTVVFATADGEEISRVVGFRPLEDFLKEVRSAWSQRTVSLDSLEKTAGKGDRNARDKLGLRHLERREYPEAVRYLEGTRKFGERLLEARIGDASTKPLPERRALFEQTLREYPNSPESLERRVEFAALLEKDGKTEERKTLLSQAVAIGTKLAGSPASLRGHDASPGDIWEQVASILEDMKETDAAKAAWASGAKAYQATVKSKLDRGPYLEIAYCLGKSGDTAGAEEIYRRFESAFPGEFTFYFSHARMTFEQKDLARARKLADQAMEHAYGDNRLRVVHLLARIERDQGQKTEARALVHSSIAETTLPADASVRTARYVQALKDLEKEL